MDDTELSMVYPTMIIVEDRGFIPRVYLPRNFKKLVPLFYQEKRNLMVEEYASQLKNIFRKMEHHFPIELCWDNQLGLIRVRVGMASCLELEDGGWPRYTEHNIGTYNGIAADMAARFYISELIKSTPISS